MIHRYKSVSIIYGGTGKAYAQALNERILKISNEERFPICATMINERILTCELLSDVMQLFKKSEFCVAFLTKDDCCLMDRLEKKRIRQNVIFELGMALIELGRERCIILSDFDINAPDFDLPSDMNSLEILTFDSSEIHKVLDDVIDKLLCLSTQSVITGDVADDIPQYNHLLTRENYRIDYENIFIERPTTLASEGREFFNDTLSYWISECNSLPHFDEKCVYLLERIGFLPIFGKTQAAMGFLEKAGELIERYRENDIRYYGDSRLLDFAQNVVQSVIDYTKLKSKEADTFEHVREYKSLLQNLISDNSIDNFSVNPLIMLAYYDYLGLIYLRIYMIEKNKEELQQAKDAFIKSLKYVSSVDMSMHIWSGFLTYNLARVYSEYSNPVDAENYFKKTINIRSKWLKNSSFNVTVRNALSYEYFISKIGYLDMCKKYQLMSEAEIQDEYNYVEKELNTYIDIDNKLERLLFVKQLLKDRTEQ